MVIALSGAPYKTSAGQSSGDQSSALPTNTGVCEGIPPLHPRESRIFGPQSETDLIHIEALGHVVPGKREWVIRTAKFNREVQRIDAMTTMAEFFSDSELTGCYDRHLPAAASVA